PSFGEAGYPFAISAHRRSEAERLVRAVTVVERDPLGDSFARLACVGIVLQIDVLVFQAAPQPLDEDVVHPAAAAIHRDFHLCLFEDGCERLAGELAALIAVEDLRLAETGER